MKTNEVVKIREFSKKFLSLLHVIILALIEETGIFLEFHNFVLPNLKQLKVRLTDLIL